MDVLMPFRAHSGSIISPIALAHLLIRIVFGFAAIRRGKNNWGLVLFLPLFIFIDIGDTA
jgi:hypothetical protein